MKKNKVFVYGTLRPFNSEVVLVPGRLYNLGSFPGVILEDGTAEDAPQVRCEVITVDDDELAGLDRYEGYYKDDHKASLYIRREYHDGFIYEYNHSVDESRRIESGEWFGRSRLKQVGVV